MHVTPVHPVTSESQFHCTKLYTLICIKLLIIIEGISTIACYHTCACTCTSTRTQQHTCMHALYTYAPDSCWPWYRQTTRMQSHNRGTAVVDLPPPPPPPPSLGPPQPSTCIPSRPQFNVHRPVLNSNETLNYTVIPEGLSMIVDESANIQTQFCFLSNGIADWSGLRHVIQMIC